MNEVLIRIIAEQERVLEHMDKIGEPTVFIKESIDRLNRIIDIESGDIQQEGICTDLNYNYRGIKTPLAPVENIFETESDNGTIEFKNFKDACISFGVMKVGDKTPTGDTKKKLEKELKTRCKWHKASKGYKIIVTEVYPIRLNREDKRSINNVYVDVVEVLIINLLTIAENKKTLYFTTNNMAEAIGMINDKFKLLNYYNEELKLTTDLLTVLNFKQTIKSEAKIIIHRSLKSMKNRRVIDYSEGRIIVNLDGSMKLANEYEMEVLTSIEKEIMFIEFGCNDFRQLESRNLKYKFSESVREKAIKEGFKEFNYSYNGFTVVSSEMLIEKALEDIEKKESSKNLNLLFIKCLNKRFDTKNKSAIKRQLKRCVMGTTILTGEASESFISDTKKLINEFVSIG